MVSEKSNKYLDLSRSMLGNTVFLHVVNVRCHDFEVIELVTQKH